MAIYLKSVLAGAAGSVAALVVFVLGAYGIAFLRMIRETQSDAGFSSGVGRVEFSGLLPLVLAALAFVAGFFWMIRHRRLSA